MKLRRIDLAVSIIAAIALWFYVVNILKYKAVGINSLAARRPPVPFLCVKNC